MEYSSKIEKRSTDLRSILKLSETIVKLATANSVRWYDHVLRRGRSCFEKGI